MQSFVPTFLSPFRVHNPVLLFELLFIIPIHAFSKDLSCLYTRNELTKLTYNLTYRLEYIKETYVFVNHIIFGLK